MCLSPEVDVIAGAAITGIGVATLLQVREKRDLIIGALPLGFGLHQLNEAFVWWGLRGQVSAGIGDAARDVYVGYAQVVLPIVVPLGFLAVCAPRCCRADGTCACSGWSTSSASRSPRRCRRRSSRRSGASTPP